MRIIELARTIQIDRKIISNFVARQFTSVEKDRNAYVLNEKQVNIIIKHFSTPKTKKANKYIKKQYKDCTGCIPESCELVSEKYCTVYPESYMLNILKNNSNPETEEE